MFKSKDYEGAILKYSEAMVLPLPFRLIVHTSAYYIPIVLDVTANYRTFSVYAFIK